MKSVFKQIYHKCGLKHVVLLLVLVAYSFLGAAMFYWFEEPAQAARFANREALLQGRHDFVFRVFGQIFNETDKFLLFTNSKQAEMIKDIFVKELRVYELNVTAFQHDFSMKIQWDFWTALLYSWTIVTTIGYGHLYPTTISGKIATMVYAIFGIPLMLLILNDLGKLLTKFMKYPGYVVKKWGRRVFQYCTKMSRDEIRLAEIRDKERLEIFDLPIPIAISIVIGWTFVCSAVQMMWEDEWDYLVAFYFFFISLSTIGLGDIAPTKPYYLLIMFGNIVIGLSLVSMCINLIQSYLERTYEAGRKKPENRGFPNDHEVASSQSVQEPLSASSTSFPCVHREPASRRGSRVSSQSVPVFIRKVTTPAPYNSWKSTQLLRVLGNAIERKHVTSNGDREEKLWKPPVELHSNSTLKQHENENQTIIAEDVEEDHNFQVFWFPRHLENVKIHPGPSAEKSNEAEILRKELSQYDNVAIFEAQEILDQIRQEDDLEKHTECKHSQASR